MRGQDVSQLNHDLVQLGYAGRTDIAALCSPSVLLPPRG